MGEDRQLYFDELNKLPGFKAFKSSANFILVEIPKEIKTSLKEFLTGKNLIVKFMNEELLNSHLRISLGTQEQNRLVINAIKEFCNTSL
jgi:histidinol-phosphate aminotransferase